MNLADNGEPPSIDLQYAAPNDVCAAEQDIHRWAQVALEQLNVGLTIRIVEASEIQSLNLQYREKNKPTNVLSFPSDYPPELDLAYLGDIALCAAVVNAEAKEQQKNTSAHWAHMVIHGVLHLRGFDHINANDAKKMEQLEVRLLASLGYVDPYTLTIQS
jgi:probable rRNA maturation factor